MNRHYYELTPRFDARQSFGGKALVEFEEVEVGGNTYTNKTLISYGHEVARLRADKGSLHLTDKWDYSPTTVRHVREFLKQEGLRIGNFSKAEIAEHFKNKIESE